MSELALKAGSETLGEGEQVAEPLGAFVLTLGKHFQLGEMKTITDGFLKAEL